MRTKNAQGVVAYLSSLDNCADVKPVRVAIGKAVYEGASYVDTAHKDGRTRLYLLGDLPASYKRRRKTCYNFAGDSRDWYIACYSTPEVIADSRYSSCHPFGLSLILMAWELPSGEAIDRFEDKPYTRVNATLESVT